MPDPETPAIDPSGTRAPNAARRALRVSVSVMLLAGGVFFWEDWSGRRKLEEVKARFEREGFPLRPEAVFPPAPPAEENFGATPALDGLFAAPGSAGEAAAAARKKALADLLPKEVQKHWELPGERVEVDWNSLREALARNAGASPLPEDLTDVAAVRTWLERHRALFTELDAAARRPHAVFTPVPTAASVGGNRSTLFSAVSALTRLLTLRGIAGVAAGDEAEALAAARVLWQLRRAALAERNLLACLIAGTMQRRWNHVALAILAMPQPIDHSLVALAGMPGAAWSPEAELRQTWHGEVMSEANCDPDKMIGGAIASGMNRRTVGLSLLAHGPRGWRHRAFATLLEARYDHVLAPLKSGSAGTFCAGLEGLASAEPTWLDTWSPFRVLQDWKVMRTLMRKVMHANQSTRLVLLAIAMERHRLRHGRYPASPSALVPDFLPQVPPDLDGQPLRVVTSPDGASAVLVSVGWNLVVDDPSGKAGSSSEQPQESPDWVLRLPHGKPR